MLTVSVCLSCLKSHTSHFVLLIIGFCNLGTTPAIFLPVFFSLFHNFSVNRARRAQRPEHVWWRGGALVVGLEQVM